jgi:hypothetical protein
MDYKIEIEGLLEVRISDIDGSNFGLFLKELSGGSCCADFLFTINNFSK